MPKRTTHDLLSSGSRRSTLTLRIWLLCFLTFACFYTPGQNSNVTTRLGLTMAMIGEHKIAIDGVAPYTIDKAVKNGHFYADKAPGLSVLAIPSVWLMSQWRGLTNDAYGENYDYKTDYSLFVYVATLFTVGLLSASAAAVLFRWCLARGSSLSGALIASLACSLASLSFPWSTIFFGHAPAGALLLIGFIALSTAIALSSA